jgi:hypothetical protein
MTSETPSATPVRPEAELLLCCARSVVDPRERERIGNLIQGGVDWACLLRMAGSHGVAPLLYRSLNTACPEAVPQDVLDQLRSRFRANGRRNLLLTGELIRLLNAFEASGILAIPFKGPALAAGVYGNLALREFGDLDVLVHERDVAKARELLIFLGYQPQYRLTRAQEEAFLRYEREYSFAHVDTGNVVELHWRVAPKPFPFSIDTDHLWECLQRVSVGGNTVPTFSPEDLFLFLCAHGAAHLWVRLGWICDVAELIRVYPNLNWERLMNRARALGIERMLLLALFLASDLLQAPLPEKISKKVRADAKVGELATQVYEQLLPATERSQQMFDGEAHFHPFHLKVMERPRDKIWYCVRQATMPILKDWALRPLPTYLFPLYRILRPIRLVGKYGRRSLERLGR